MSSEAMESKRPVAFEETKTFLTLKKQKNEKGSGEYGDRMIDCGIDSLILLTKREMTGLRYMALYVHEISWAP